MESRKRMVVLAGVLLLVMLCGCARLFWNVDEQSGWYIELNVGDPGAKGIGVGAYEVTRLEITVQGPGIHDPVSIVWNADEGPRSYIVQVTEGGTHRIDVTHISDTGGEVVKATESAQFDIEPMEITVINITPGAVGMIGVEPGEEEPIDLTGYWDAFLTPTGEDTHDAHLLYMVQSDSTLNAFGVSGSVDGSAVTLIVDEEAAFTGTIETECVIRGSYDWGEESGTFELLCADLLFGHLELGGMIDLSTDRALGYKGEDEIEYRLDFHIRAGALEGSLAFINSTGLDVGSYAVIPRSGAPSPGPSQVIGWFFENWDEEHEVQTGTLTLDQYGPTEVSGSFSLEFEEGDYLNGIFELGLPVYSGGQVSITGGSWNGSPVTPETAGGLLWSAGTESKWGRCDIQYLEEDRDLWLELEPRSGTFSAGTFSVPDEYWVRIGDDYDNGSEMEEDADSGDAESGTLVITSYEEGVGASGYFEDMIFSGGTLSADFEVSFQLREYE